MVTTTFNFIITFKKNFKYNREKFNNYIRNEEVNLKNKAERRRHI